MPCSTAHRPIASTSSGGYTAPVGLRGDTNSSTLVREVRGRLELVDRDAEARASPWWAARPARRRRARSPRGRSSSTAPGAAPRRPGPAASGTCCRPRACRRWSRATWRGIDRRSPSPAWSCAAMARRSSGRPGGRASSGGSPGRGRRRPPPRRCARGVGKSGSPAPKPITGSPAAFSAFALASTASVADSAMDAMRRETREPWVTAPSWHGHLHRTVTPPTRPPRPPGRAPDRMCPGDPDRPAPIASQSDDASRPIRARALARLTATVAATVALLVPATAAAAPSAPAPSTPTTPPVTAPPPATQSPQSYVAVRRRHRRDRRRVNEHVPHLTASTIKMLTALVALERLPMTASSTSGARRGPAGDEDLDAGGQHLDARRTDARVVDDGLGQRRGVRPGRERRRDLDRFAAIAEQAPAAAPRASKDTTFEDPAGLDGAEGFGGGTTSSAYDLAIIARNALAVPAIVDTAAKVSLPTSPTRTASVGTSSTTTRGSSPATRGDRAEDRLHQGRQPDAARRARDATVTRASRRVMGTWDDTGWAGHLLDQCFAGVRVAGAAPLPACRYRPAGPRRRLTGRPRSAPPHDGTDHAAARRDQVQDHEPTAVPAPEGVGRQEPPAGGAPPERRRDHGGCGLGRRVRLGHGPDGHRPRAGRPARHRLRAAAAGGEAAAGPPGTRMRAHAEARRRGMIDVVEPDTTGSDLRVMPERTATTCRRLAGTSRSSTSCTPPGRVDTRTVERPE